MAKYGQTSRKNLATCHPDLIMIFMEVIQYQDCSIICGHRPEKEQDIAFTAGATKVMWPDSNHNSLPSMAVDAPPYPIDWQDLGRFYIFAGRVIQIADRLFEEGKISHRVRYGGDWDGDGRTKDQKFNDLPHFELYLPN